MIISFGWTAEYLPPNGSKNTTRRIWKPRTLEAWQRAYDNGRLTHTAVNKCLAYGGHRIGLITLTSRPYLEIVGDMPEEDLIHEGGMVKTVDEFIATYFNGDRHQPVAVVRFNFVPTKPKEYIQLSFLET